MKELILHVGLPKTGTSTIQRSVFVGHSQIFYLGKYTPSDVSMGCVSQQVYDLLNPLLWTSRKKIDINHYKMEYHKLIEKNVSEHQVIVGSWEALGNLSTEKFRLRLERLNKVCGNIKLLITIRNPLEWLPSIYLQDIHGQFTKRSRSLFGMRAFLDFETWMRRHEEKYGSVSKWLCYVENIKQAMAVFGKDNTGVFVFEELKSSPVDFYTSIARFMNIDSDEFLKLAEGSHHNKRLLQGELEYSRQLDLSFFNRMHWLVQSSRQRRQKRLAASTLHPDYNRPAQVQISDAWIDKVVDSTREGNRWLSEEFELELEKYHYSV